MAAGGEERIQRQPLDLRRHATAIVGNAQLDMTGSGRAYGDIDRSVETVRECVGQGVDDEVRQHLSEWAGIAVHNETGFALKVESDGMLLQVPGEMRQHLLG